MSTAPSPAQRAIRTRAAGAAAALWGFVLFMPVGMNYLAAGLLLLALALGSDRDERRLRSQRFRTSPLYRPLLAFAAWILIVLLARPHHPETGISLWHDFRIWLTLAMTTVLSSEEAAAAVKGFAAAALLALLAILLAQVTSLPELPPLHHVIVMKGNKSINDALLFALIGVSAAVLGLASFGQGRRGRRIAALAGVATVAAGLVASIALPSRTSLVGLVVAILGCCLHQWRGHLRALLTSFAVAGAAAAALLWLTPSVQQKFELGLQELQTAQAGTVSEGSWVVRYYMYRETAQMVLDRPLAGWGLGAWTPEWQRRGPALLADYSMPHNDFLWLGSETGMPGLLILLWIMLAAGRAAWRRRDLAGRLAFGANLLLLVATSLNSAFRDAAIGLSLPWIAFVYLRLGPLPWPIARISAFPESKSAFPDDSKGPVDAIAQRRHPAPAAPVIPAALDGS